jgi:hypothetical protein
LEKQSPVGFCSANNLFFAQCTANLFIFNKQHINFKVKMITVTVLQRFFFRVQSIRLPRNNFRDIECLSKALGVSHFGINSNFSNDVWGILNDQS